MLVTPTFLLIVSAMFSATTCSPTHRTQRDEIGSIIEVATLTLTDSKDQTATLMVPLNNQFFEINSQGVASTLVHISEGACLIYISGGALAVENPVQTLSLSLNPSVVEGVTCGPN
jgi:hypothetical protein